MTTLANYQARAAATAQKEAYDLAYLVPMIVGEVGELHGQKAKAHWHGWTPARLQEELVSEFGDVCWGTAILLDMYGIRSTPEQLLGQPRTPWGDELDPWHILLQRATGLHLFYIQLNTHRYLPGEATQLWLALEKYCHDITGLPFQDVLDYNVKKLADRAARGVLQGSGDHR